MAVGLCTANDPHNRQKQSAFSAVGGARIGFEET
jgi:hypothetical protein